MSGYDAVRSGGSIGYYKSDCGLIKVSGAEAEMFLSGLITNDIKNFEDHTWKIAAFPNAQGRTLAITRVSKFADGFVFETEDQTYDKVLKNLERFTMAGDFRVEDWTERFICVSVRGEKLSGYNFPVPNANDIISQKFGGETGFVLRAVQARGCDIFLPAAACVDFERELKSHGAAEIDENELEIMRIENGLPLYNVDVDETTIVPELNLPDLISYNKGCYIGQEIIARIHFRGHVAKKLTGLVFDSAEANVKTNDEIVSAEGKNAGRVTSVTFSPKLNKKIALAFVRYDYLAAGTTLKINNYNAIVKDLPFVD